MHKFRRELLFIAAIALTVLASPDLRAQSLFEARFDDVAGRPAEWRVLDAPAQGYWEVINGEFMTGNGDLLGGGNARSYAVVNASNSTSWRDYVVSADVWMSQRNGTVALVGRWQNASAHYEGSIEFNENQRTARIVKVSGVSGGDMRQREVLAQGSLARDGLAIPAMSSGRSRRDAHRISVSFQGPQITLSIDGQRLLTAKDNTYRSGTAGIGNYRNQAYYDNFVVQPANGAPTAVAAAGATGAAATPRPTPVTATPRFTPAVRPIPPQQAAKLPAITRPVPETILQNMDLAELKQRMTPEEQRAFEQMTEVDQLALLKSIRTRMISSTGAGSAEMAAEIDNLKKQLEQLTASQKKIADDVSGRMLQDREVTDGILSVDTLRDVGNIPAALARATDLLVKYPENPLLLERKRALERLSKGTFEGYEQALAQNQERYNTLVAQAQSQENSGNLEGAISSWTTIIGMSPSEDAWLTQANTKINALSQQMVEKNSRRDEAIASMDQNRLLVYAGVGATILLAILVLFFLMRFAKRSRARDEEILSQVKDLTQPLIEMQTEIRQLTGTGMLALPEISDLSPSSEPSPKPLPDPKKDKKSKKSATPPVAAAAPAQDLDSLTLEGFDAPGAGSEDDLFTFDPLGGTAATDEVVSPASPQADEEDPFAALTFPDPDFSAPDQEQKPVVDFSANTIAPTRPSSTPPVKEVELVPSAPSDDQGPLDLGLDDLLGSSPSSPPRQTSDFESETIKLDTGSFNIDEPLNLDLDLQSAEEPQPAAFGEPVEESAIDLFADNEADVEPAPVTIVPEPVPLTSTGGSPKSAASAGKTSSGNMPGLIFEQDFEEQPVGSRPDHWVGDEKENVSFHVVEHQGHKVLRYFKNAGSDSVHFYCQFPNVSGVVSIEFDISCPQKNKYLLGLYIERDGNYNQAVRTVVHCIDPSAASIRMQNEPVNYQLGQWCHVRYLIDLYQGTIDGYLDDEQVLTQQTFVNKPSSVNTLSIRDNHATTGELLIDNVRIEKMA